MVEKNKGDVASVDKDTKETRVNMNLKEKQREIANQTNRKN